MIDTCDQLVLPPLTVGQVVKIGKSNARQNWSQNDWGLSFVIQKYPSDGATNKQFPKQCLAGFWHRWYLFGWFPAILNSPMPLHITKSDWNMFSILLWMHISSETNFNYYSKFGQINTHEKPAWFFWWIFLFPHRGPLCNARALPFSP